MFGIPTPSRPTDKSGLTDKHNGRLNNGHTLTPKERCRWCFAKLAYIVSSAGYASGAVACVRCDTPDPSGRNPFDGVREPA